MTVIRRTWKGHGTSRTKLTRTFDDFANGEPEKWVEYTPADVVSTYTTRRGANVDHYEKKIGNIEITVNRYDGDNQQVQVFVDDAGTGETHHALLPLDQVDVYVAQFLPKDITKGG